MSESYITVDNVWGTIHGPMYPTVARLLAYRKKGYQFTKAYKERLWDGWTKVVSNTGKFPAGLVPYVVEQMADRHGVRIPVADVRTETELDYCLKHAERGTPLMEYQKTAIDKAYKAQRGLIHHPVGSGKTHILTELTRRVGLRGLVLVHTKDLLHQLIGQLQEHLGLPGCVGRIGDGVWAPHCVTVATFQSIYSRLRDYPKDIKPWLEEIGQVHVDEVQHLPAKSFSKVMRSLPNARYRYGYSATPLKSEGDQDAFIRVQGWTGPIIDAMPMEKGIEVGRLVPADIFLFEPGEPAPSPLSWPLAYATGIVDHEGRNDIICTLTERFRKTGPVLILVDRIRHGLALAERLKCPFLRGSVPGKARAAGWDRVRQGKDRVVIATKIADEGLDIPNIRFLVLAGGGAAEHLVIQRLGRGMRASEGKSNLVVVDFLDEGRWLGKHTRKRMQTYGKHGAYTTIRTTLEEVLG